MSSEVEICNLALSNIRGGSINSLTEGSVQAQQCKLKYPIMRDMLLKDAPWGFNTKVAPLALLATVDIFNWSYAYQYPSDCLHVNKLILNIEAYAQGDGITRLRYPGEVIPDLERQVKYDVMNESNNKVIVANEPDLRINYRATITDPNLFDRTFIIALSWLMASELAIPVAGGETGRALRSDALKIYQSYLSSAVAADLNQEFVEQPESEFIQVRQT